MQLRKYKIKYKLFVYLNADAKTYQQCILLSLNILLQTISTHPKADKAIKEQVGSPMPGSVVDIRVKAGDEVKI